MKDIKDIGFYTMSDKRVKQISSHSSLWRCELILTDKCNFKCPYCRGVKSDIAGVRTFEEAKNIVDLWCSQNLKNIRFSGGEPTTWKDIEKLVKYTKSKPSIEHIAISSNGSASLEFYKKLIDAGVNDYSISLDACCASFGDKMAGNIKGAWEHVVSNISELSKLTYITVGVVVTEETLPQLVDVVTFADSLGVSDIRIISAAQFDKILTEAEKIPQNIIDKYPILKYRIENIKNGRNVRGIKDNDSDKCGLVLDDMAIAGNQHFPCIIYMREGGKAVGIVGPNMRQEREKWHKNHNTHNDQICKKNCLDVCIDLNNKYREVNNGNA